MVVLVPLIALPSTLRGTTRCTLAVVRIFIVVPTVLLASGDSRRVAVLVPFRADGGNDLVIPLPSKLLERAVVRRAERGSDL